MTTPQEDAQSQAGQEPTAEHAAPAAAEDQADLTKLLEDSRAKADEHWNQVLRAQAELDNLRKRHERDLENAHKYALDSFAAELLKVWDSLELGLNAAQENQTDITSLREGMELTLKLFQDTLGKFGIEQLNPVGAPFDPHQHQAISLLDSDQVPPDHVVSVLQKGYTLNQRILRPALVMVARPQADTAAPAIDEEA